jgi:hypothetical protein
MVVASWNGCKRPLVRAYSRKFITAIDVLNEAVFRKDAESIAKALAGAKCYYALLKELEKTQTNLRFFFDVCIDARLSINSI